MLGKEQYSGKRKPHGMVIWVGVPFDLQVGRFRETQ